MGPPELVVDLAEFLLEGVTVASQGDAEAEQEQAEGSIAVPTNRFDPTVLDGLEADLVAVDAALLEIDGGRYEGAAWSRIGLPTTRGES